MISQRLKQLRQARGLSLEALAAAMGGIVTKQALSKYEKGKARPSPVVLIKLAETLHTKAARLWSKPTVHVEFIAYRKLSRLPKKEQSRVECLVRHTFEERIRLQNLTQEFDGSDLPVHAYRIDRLEAAEHAADALRKKWDLGYAPIASVVGVLEGHSIHVLQVDVSQKFDGLSAVAYDDSKQVAGVVVVTRRDVSGERQRLNLTHELGHVVLKISGKVDEEKAAFRFGAAFLAPATLMYQEAGTKRAYILPEELILLKRRFGMSFQALLYRLRDLRIITESYYKKWCVDINRFGWRKQEPAEMPPEQPQWFRQHVLRALAEGMVSREEAEQILGEAMGGSLSLSLIERRAFLKLPLEERRKLLAEQAEKMREHYRQDSEWKELQAGDLVEY